MGYEPATQDDRHRLILQTLDAIMEQGRREGFHTVTATFDTGSTDGFNSALPSATLDVTFGLRSGETPMGEGT